MNKAAIKFLRERDATMASLIDYYGVLKTEKRSADFDALVKIIISQQLSSKAASTIFGRLQGIDGNPKLKPAAIELIPDERFKSAGVSHAKTNYIKNIASLVAAEPGFFTSLSRMNNERVFSRLTDLKGIGAWSASIFMMFYLGREDIFPSGDASLNKAITNHYGEIGSTSEVFSRRWSPHRTLACQYLWKSVDQPVVVS